MKMKALALSALALAFALDAQAKSLVYCSEGSPEGFNPQLYASGTTYDASSIPLYNRLVDFKPGTTEIAPSLAQSWEISADGKEYVFHLRPGVKWHTTKNFTPSRPLTADDVTFSFDRQLNKNNPYHNVSGGSYEYFYGMDMPAIISKIEKIDDLTVKFTLSKPQAPFLADLAMGFASILSQEYAAQMLKAGTPEQLDLSPVGTGPFQLVQYQKDSKILYQRHPGFWGEKPKIDRLVFSITPDSSVRYAKLQKNECQIMAYPNPADLPKMQQDPRIVLMSGPGLNVGYLSFNVSKKPLDNVKVRQALIMAVDKKAIIDAVYQGGGQAAKNLIPPSLWAYNDRVRDYPYDPQRARALLQEAGVGPELTVDLWAMPVQRPYNPNARRMAEMIQSDWGKVGVKANIVSYEWGEYLKRAKAGEPQTVMMGWGGDNGDPDNFFMPLFSCAAAQSGSNYSRWCYPPFDALISRAQSLSDMAQRKQDYQQAQQIMHDQAPALIIAHSTLYEPVSKQVIGYTPGPLGQHNFQYADVRQ